MFAEIWKLDRAPRVHMKVCGGSFAGPTLIYVIRAVASPSLQLAAPARDVQHEQVPVPKFGSFKPKPKPTASNVAPQRKEERDPTSSPARDGKSHARHRSRDRNEDGSDRRRRRRDSRHRHQRNHKHESSERQRLPTLDLIQDEIEESDAYIADRRGDAKNVEYGSLHRYSIPAYHRVGYGRIIGSAFQKIDRDENNDKNVVLRANHGTGQKRAERLLTKSLHHDDRRALRLIVPAPENEDLELEDDFIELCPSLKRKRESQSLDPDDVGVDYRSVGGKLQSSDRPEDDDFEYSSDSDKDAERDTTELEIQRENAALFKKAKQYPTNSDSWLALIGFQPRVSGLDTDPAVITNAERLRLAKSRIKIYEQALRHVAKGSASHSTLFLGFLEEGSLIWESAKLKAKWSDAMKECPGNTEVGMKYLDFLQKHHVEFSYDKCKNVYIQCLRALYEKFRNGFGTSQANERDELCSVQVYVILRLTNLMRDAGYDELAYAIWQAILEYRFFAPSSMENREAKLESFEQFWESDVPRIGEKDAQGWSRFGEEGATCARSTSTISDPFPDQHKEPWTVFAEHEFQFLGVACLPAAADDDGSQSEDPFRFVMFSDLREVIECLIEGLPENILVEGFLRFSDLPSLACGSGQLGVKNWDVDHSLRTEPISLLSWQGVSKTFSCDIENQVQTMYSLFGDAFHSFCERITNFGVGGTMTARFIDRVFDRLVSIHPDNDALIEYYVAFKACVFPQEATKAAKRHLKSRPSSLRLYNAYALTEWCLGNREKATEVWTTALGMRADFDEKTRDDEILLSHSWMLTAILRGDESEALRCLLLESNGRTLTKGADKISVNITAGQRLIMFRHLEERLERVLLKQESTYAILYIECLAWLFYLLEDHSLERPLQIFDGYVARISDGSRPLALELIHQAKARMQKFHIEKRRPYKPAALRYELAESLKLFPENSLLLTVFAQAGAKNRLYDRLRDSIRSDTLSPASTGLVRWSFAIAEEFRHWRNEATGSTQNSVRSIFTRALLSPDNQVKHCPSLWMWWFAFECSLVHDQGQAMLSTGAQRDEDKRRAKQVFSDGLRYLPWYKPWIIMGLKYFGRDGSMTESELRRVYDVLSEREMRVRSSFGEFEI